jgi:hypothetical protein
MDPITQIVTQSLPIIVAAVAPILTAYAKQIVPEIPKVFIPLTSVAVGTIAGLVTDLGAQNGAIAGAVGVAVREILDQLKKTIDTDPSV